jgi:hypothetical protein
VLNGRALQRENRRKRSKKLGRGEGIKSKEGGKCRGEETDEISEENGWEVLNGNKEGDEEGEWTNIGSTGETVIDYGIVNEEAWERVEKNSE